LRAKADGSLVLLLVLDAVLTVVATIFLTLTVITSFFGMNFAAISDNLQTNWTFLVLGLLLPAASVVVSYLLYRRLAGRFRVGTIPEIGK
jgi:hypothetical protein